MTYTATALNAAKKPAHGRGVRILKWAAIIVAAIVACLIAFIVLFSASVIRHVAGGAGSSATGRTFAIEGPLSIDWDWTTPRVHVENIRLSNDDGYAEPDMVNIKRMDFTIKVWQLLYGKMNFPELTVDGAKIVLEKRDDDHKNWDFPAMSKANVVNKAAVPQSRSSMPVIEALTLSNSELVYKDDVKKLNLDLMLNSANGAATGSNKRAQDGISIEGHGTLQDKTFELKAKGGSVAMLRNSSTPFPLNIHMQMGGTLIDVEGTFKDPVKMSGIDATLSVQGDNLADLFYLTAIPLPPSPSYEITGRLSNDTDLWSYSSFTGKVGASDLAGDLKYDTSGKRGFVTLNIVSNYLDMNDMSGFIGKAPSTKHGAELGPKQQKMAREQAASSRLLPDVPINLDRLRATDMSVDLDAKKFVQPGTPLESLKVHVDLHDGLLKIDPLTVGVASGKIEGALILDGRQAVPDVGVNVVMKKLSFHDFFKGSRFADLSSGHFGGRINVDGKGKSLADVLAVSDGDITLTMAGGKVSLLLVKAAGIDIANAIPLLADDTTTSIRCAVGDFKVTNGLLTSRAFVFDTEDSNIEGDARINLKDETIDAQVRANPKSASALEPLTPITISGRLKHPRIGLDPKEAGARAGIAVGLSAVLTPLAAIIPFINLGLGEDSDCRGLIRQAQQHAGSSNQAH